MVIFYFFEPLYYTLSLVYAIDYDGTISRFSLHLLQSIWEGNLYLGPLETMWRILESELIFTFPVTTWQNIHKNGSR